MKAAVVVFPGSNCDRDMAVALRDVAGADVSMVWHKDQGLPAGTDLVAIPGGFSFGDYLRCGAIAAHSPIMRAVIAFAGRGGYVLGVCNGFQVLTECGLLPGSLMMNAGLKFLCKPAPVRIEATDSVFTSTYARGDVLSLPIAHHEGNYAASDADLDRIEGDGRIALRYCAPDGSAGGNPNGAARDIAGLVSENRRVLGMMPHPERASDPALGPTHGAALFRGLAALTVPA